MLTSNAVVIIRKPGKHDKDNASTEEFLPYAEGSIAWTSGELRTKDEVAVVAILPAGLCKCQTGAC